MMGAMNEKPSRTVRAWIVVSRDGHPFIDSARSLRRDAIEAYEAPILSWTNYKKDHRKYGVQVVRCSITTGDERT